jgi:hypothetical protein
MRHSSSPNTAPVPNELLIQIVKIIGLVSGMNTLDWLRYSEQNREIEFDDQYSDN